LACGHATAAPPQDTKKFPPLHVNPPAGHRIRSLSASIGAGFELLICKVLMSFVGQKTEVSGARAARPFYPQDQISSAPPTCPFGAAKLGHDEPRDALFHLRQGFLGGNSCRSAMSRLERYRFS
jgi:hypothetical protein